MKDVDVILINRTFNYRSFLHYGDKEEMFEKPYMVFKDGEIIVKNGKIQKVFNGKFYIAETEYDKNIEKEISSYFEKYMGRKMQNFEIQNQELWDHGIETENIHCDRNDY